MRVISFLGTGQYQPTHYLWPESGASCCSHYVAVALAHFLKAREVVVLATEKAEAVHGQALTEAFAEAGLALPRLERIRNGQSPQELWENFNLLSELLRAGKGIDTVLDITHGFRSQPFFAGAVVSFVRATEPEPPAIRMVYGAFEAPAADKTPIWDLTTFVDLVDWTQAIGIFLASGQGQALAQRAERLGQALARGWAKTKQGPPPRIKKFASALEAFSQALATVRTGELLLARGKHASAAKWLMQALDEAGPDLQAHLPPVAQVLEKIRTLLEPLQLPQDHLAGLEGQKVVAELARLYLHFGRYAEAAITLREGWVNLYARPEATRPGESFDPEGRRAAEARLQQAGHAERELMGLRNDIEHGGYRKKPLPADAISEQLERFVSEFERAQPSEAAPPKPGAVWFVSRHPGAVEWARRQGIQVDRLVDHLEIDQVQESDVVIGTLPVHLAAAVSARGARFLNLSLDLPPDERGKELSTDDLERFGARLEEYRLERIGEHRPASI